MNKLLRKISPATFATFAILAIGFTPLGATDALAKKDPVYTRTFSNAGAGGYDVTAYFSEARAVEGSKEFTADYNGAKWYFASRENLEKFTADPKRYAPQYGGYCAWAVAENKIASGDPLLWTVHDDKLYLNYDKKINDRWSGDKENFIIAGDMNWPAVLD